MWYVGFPLAASRISHDLFHLGVPWPEKVLRALVVYAFLLVAIRLFGRRELGQLTAFDLIVLLTLSNILQNAMIGNDNSLAGGLLGAIFLLSVNLGVALAVFRSRRLERVVNGEPRVLIKDGRLILSAMRAEMLTEQDLLSAVRRDGMLGFDEVHMAVSEPNGMISVIPKRHG
jgi:uncharacterized membrane protein YcaP (DUF421 family)